MGNIPCHLHVQGSGGMYTHVLQLNQSINQVVDVFIACVTFIAIRD